MFPVNNIYIYVKKQDIDDCLKYGIKLSEYSNTTIVYSENLTKRGIGAFFSPKDSEKFTSDFYDVLRIDVSNVKVLVGNITDENFKFEISKVQKLEDYKLGTFMNPIPIICSSIMPEDIHKYNKILDVPLLVNNSKDLYFDVQNEIMAEKTLKLNFNYSSLLELVNLNNKAKNITENEE